MVGRPRSRSWRARANCVVITEAATCGTGAGRKGGGKGSVAGHRSLKHSCEIIIRANEKISHKETRAGGRSRNSPAGNNSEGRDHDMRYGYARLPGRAKTLNPATKTLREAGCTTVFREATPASRNALKRMLSELGKNDIVMVTALDQLAGSTAELLETLQILHANGAKLESLADPWTKGMSPAAIGNAVTSVGRFQGAARAAAGEAGRERARAAGKFGRPPRLTPAQEEEVRRRHRAQEASIRDLAKEMKVGRSTIERALRKTV